MTAEDEIEMLFAQAHEQARVLLKEAEESNSSYGSPPVSHHDFQRESDVDNGTNQEIIDEVDEEDHLQCDVGSGRVHVPHFLMNLLKL